jgi:hypothetical protein
MFYARISINGGRLCLSVPNNNSKASFRTLKAAQGRLEAMGGGFGYGYDKSKGEAPRVQGQVTDNRGRVLWSVAL